MKTENFNNNSEFTCHECGKLLPTARYLEEHIAYIHQGIVKYMCSNCNKGFERSSFLREHIKHSHLEKRFHCESCDFKTSIRNRFETHKQSHTGEQVVKAEKSLDCVHCDLKFSRKDRLRSHMSTHTAEAEDSKPSKMNDSYPTTECVEQKPKKIYQCEYCSYTSTYKNNFESHVRTHTGEKPFACDQCPLRFATQGYFKTHLKIHSGESKVACSYCGLKFNDSYI